MHFFDWTRWLRSQFQPRRKTYRKHSRVWLRPQCEALEDRTMLSTLPAAVVTNQSTLLAGSISPDLVQDPANPLKMVEVATTGATLTGEFSTDGGQTWTAFNDAVSLTDPTTDAGFTTVTNPTAAMDQAGNLYIAAIERNANINTAGAVVFERWQFTGAAPSQTGAEAAEDLFPLGAAPVNGQPGSGGAQWEGANPIENAVVAVDDNVPSFTDTTAQTVTNAVVATGGTGYAVGQFLFVQGGTFTTQAILEVSSINAGNGAITGVTISDPGVYSATPGNPVTVTVGNATFTLTFTAPTQTDPMAALVADGFGANGTGVDKGLYVAWNTNNVAGNENVIMVTGSGDGGMNWTAPQIVAGPSDADPQIVFTQGSADGRVAGGQLVFLWNDFGADGFQLASSTPDGGGAGNIASASLTSTGSLAGEITTPFPTGPAAASPATTGNAAAGAFSDAYAQIASITVANGGNDAYNPGQVLTLSGGTVGPVTSPPYTAGMVKVDTVSANPPPGAVVTAHLNNPTTNAYLVIPPNNPDTETTGEGATFGLTYGPDIPVTTTFTDTVNAAGANWIVNDVSLTLDITDPTLSGLSISLTSPDGTVIQLLDNEVDTSGNPTGLGITGANLGEITTDGVTFDVGTVFDDDAPAPITTGAIGAPKIGRFTPEGTAAGTEEDLDVAGKTVGVAINSAAIAGTWTLSVTDSRNDRGAAAAIQSVDHWFLTFSHISTTGFGTVQDVALPTGFEPEVAPLAGATNEPYANAGSFSFGPDGAGPGLSVAIDNTLGADSPFEGRIYLAYTGVGTTVIVNGNPAIPGSTDVYLASIDDLDTTGFTTTFNDPVQVNDDSAADGFSQGDRPEFMPTVAVDPVTGTVGVMYYDGRWDSAEARVGNSFSDSIDGGDTFSPSVFLNTPKTATDELSEVSGSSDTITLEPVPGNPNETTDQGLGFGDSQGLVMFGGSVVPVFTSNDNAVGQSLLTDTMTIAAGPRIVYGDMGPIAADFVSPDASETVYNDTFASDGTRLFSAFVVQFDRPVLPATFTGNDVTVEYRDTTTSASLPANLTVAGKANFTITPLDASTTEWGPETLATAMAETFLISLVTPLSGVGTYSYAIGNLTTGPAITDGIKTVSRPTTGNLMDQNQNRITGEAPDFVTNAVTLVAAGRNYAVGDLLSVIGGTLAGSAPTQVPTELLVTSAVGGAITGVSLFQAGAYTVEPANPVSVTDINGVGSKATFDLTYTSTAGDVFAVPTPTDNGPPFVLPYDQNTLPLIIPGPQMTSSSVLANPDGSATATDNLVLNGTNNATTVTFDRQIQPGSFTPANIISMEGPAGAITPYALGPAVTFTGGGGLGATGVSTVVDGVVTAVAITNGGGGYTSAPTVIFDGSAATSAAIFATGSGYKVNDLLTVLGGTFSTPTELEVTAIGAGGAIIGVTIIQAAPTASCRPIRSASRTRPPRPPPAPGSR